MQKGIRKTAKTREMLRSKIDEIRYKLINNMYQDIKGMYIDGNEIMGCIEHNPKKVLMPIYIPPGFYIIIQKINAPKWLFYPINHKLEKNMYWKASGIAECDESSEVIPFSLGILELRGYIFSLKCDDAIGIMEIYHHKPNSSTKRGKLESKKDHFSNFDMKLKINKSNLILQSNMLLTEIKKESDIANDVDQCSPSSGTKRLRENPNDSAPIPFLDPPKSEYKRVKLGKDVKDNSSFAQIENRMNQDDDLDSFLSDIDKYEASLQVLPQSFDAIDYS